MESKILMSLLKQKGYQGSQRTLQRYLSGLREVQGLPPARIQVDKPLPKDEKMLNTLSGILFRQITKTWEEPR